MLTVFSSNITFTKNPKTNCILLPMAALNYVRMFQGSCQHVDAMALMYVGNGDNDGSVADRAKACANSCILRKDVIKYDTRMSDWGDYIAKGFILQESTGRCWCQMDDSVTCKRTVADKSYHRYDIIDPSTNTSTSTSAVPICPVDTVDRHESNVHDLDTIENNGYTYLFSKTVGLSAANHAAAQSSCNLYGMDLLWMSSNSEESFVRATVMPGNDVESWFGCHDRIGESKFLNPDGSSCGTQFSGGNSETASNLQACNGECDNDSQCASGLKCFQRDNNEQIPGCVGSHSGDDWDYCYDPAASVYSNWRSGEPNDVSGEDCALLYSSSGWNDKGCEYSRDYVCKGVHPGSTYGRAKWYSYGTYLA